MIELSREQEILKARLDVLQEEFYVESINEWRNIDRCKKRELLREHKRLLIKARVKLATLSA